MAIAYPPSDLSKNPPPSTSPSCITTSAVLLPRSSSEHLPSRTVTTTPPTINCDGETTIDFTLKLDTVFSYPVVVTIKHVLKITYPTLPNTPEVCYELENSYIVNPPPPSDYALDSTAPVQNMYTCKFALPPGCLPPTNSQVNINIFPS
jgi:hypothetical protein